MKRELLITGTKRLFALFITLVLLFACVCIVPISAETETDSDTEGYVPKGDRIIVSLGDSYSSGEGVGNYYDADLPKDSDKVKSQDWLAHRSKDSWPALLKLNGVDGLMREHRNTNWFFAACTGAKTENFNSSQSIDYDKGIEAENLFSYKRLKDSGTIDPQKYIFDHENLKGKTADYVTFTLGGNDADFGNIVLTAANPLEMNPNALNDKLTSVWREFYDENNGIRKKLYDVYHDISDKANENATYRQSTLVVVGYPQLFSGAKSNFYVNDKEAKLVNDNVHWFNQSIENIVLECQSEGMKIHFVTVEDVFLNHGAFSSDSFLNDVYLGTRAEENQNFKLASSESVHPNQKGAQAYADRVNDVLYYLDNQSAPKKPDPRFNQVDSLGERDVVLVLDRSGSMSGDPIANTKEAAYKFVDSVSDTQANIGIVTYSDDAVTECEFTQDPDKLIDAIRDISTGGGTNIDAGLSKAVSMLNYRSTSTNAKKIIVLMSDGQANEGRVGTELIDYAEMLRNQGIYIYTLGFFEELSGYEKADCQFVMEHIASAGCHYEVTDPDSLVFFFGDIADQINGQKYIYVRIACPVDVTVRHYGEVLDSSDSNLSTRTSFGTLTFEDADTQSDDYSSYSDSYDSYDSGDRVKILRLKEGEDYDIRINGTGNGTMDYKIGFMDENGEYSDFREFENIKITDQTRIDTIAEVADSTVLNVDSDNDGVYDLQYVAAANEKGVLSERQTVKPTKIATLFLVLIIIVSLLVAGVLIVKIMMERRKAQTQKIES